MAPDDARCRRRCRRRRRRRMPGGGGSDREGRSSATASAQSGVPHAPREILCIYQLTASSFGTGEVVCSYTGYAVIAGRHMCEIV